MPIGSINSFVRNVTVVAFVGIGNESLIVKIVVGGPIVSMTNLNVSV